MTSSSTSSAAHAFSLDAPDEAPSFFVNSAPMPGDLNLQIARHSAALAKQLADVQPQRRNPCEPGAVSCLEFSTASTNIAASTELCGEFAFASPKIFCFDVELPRVSRVASLKCLFRVMRNVVEFPASTSRLKLRWRTGVSSCLQLPCDPDAASGNWSTKRTCGKSAWDFR